MSMNGLLSDDGISSLCEPLHTNKNSGVNNGILGQGTKAYEFQRAFVELMQKIPGL